MGEGREELKKRVQQSLFFSQSRVPSERELFLACKLIMLVKSGLRGLITFFFITGT